MLYALLIVHAQGLRCRTHAVRGMARRAASVDIDAANAKAAAVDLDAANAKAKRVWAEVAVAAPELAPDTRPFGDGAAPAGLKGTWYVNGLASCRVGDRLVHPFEAHGFVKAFTFDGKGGATLTTRFVETPCQRWEARLQRPLVRGAMSNVAEFDKFPAVWKSTSELGYAETFVNLHAIEHTGSRTTS